MLIPIDTLIKHHRLNITGVLHIGAHQAEEAEAYHLAGAREVIWIEGNPELMPTLADQLTEYPHQRAYNVLVSDVNDQPVEFRVTNNLQSSSILALGTHRTHHPDVKVDHTLVLRTQRLDKFFTEHSIDIGHCTFLNIDIQGAELLALKGLGDYLDSVQYVYTEVNVGNVYVGCVRLFELDRFLHSKGFVRVALHLTQWQWGDAFYVRRAGCTPQKYLNLAGALLNQARYFASYWLSPAVTAARKALGPIKRKAIRTLMPNTVITQTVNVDPNENGERRTVAAATKTSRNKPLVIFDVGANVGKYAEMTLEVLAESHREDYELHLFEPQQLCFDELSVKFAANSRVVLNHFALSDTSGEAVIRSDFSGSSSASLYDRNAISLPVRECVRVERIDEYMNKRGISHVDLIKIDTEGNEKKVILGAGSFLSPSLIHCIQFEYGGTYLDAGATLREVVQVLVDRGYRVGRVSPEHIQYRSHVEDFEESYSYSNFLASRDKMEFER